MPTPREAIKPRDESSLLSVLMLDAVLLRMRSTYPRVYGHLGYMDPCADYLRVCTYGGGRCYWAGTEDAFYSVWEAAAPVGSA